MPDVIIYLGPSLSKTEAEIVLPSSPDIDYRPPVRRGDLVQAIRDKPKIIGIIDGLFFENAAVGHREILSAIKAGIQVVGASSMGALRAAELSSFGMQGVGEVFRRYHDGEIESDDEVALICDPIGNCALSEALVNIRITLERATEEGILDGEQAHDLLVVAQKSYYPDRTWSSIIKSGVVSPNQAETLKNWLIDNKVDQKQEDARAALQYISNMIKTSKEDNHAGNE